MNLPKRLAKPFSFLNKISLAVLLVVVAVLGSLSCLMIWSEIDIFSYRIVLVFVSLIFLSNFIAKLCVNILNEND